MMSAAEAVMELRAGGKGRDGRGGQSTTFRQREMGTSASAGERGAATGYSQKAAGAAPCRRGGARVLKEEEG